MVVWDILSGDELFRLNHDTAANGALWKADDTQIVTWATGDIATIWDAETGQILLSLQHDTERSLSAANWTPNGELLMTYTLNGLIKVWDVSSIEG